MVILILIIWILCGVMAYNLTKDDDHMFQSFPEAVFYCAGAFFVVMFGPLSLLLILFLKCVR